MHTFWLNKTICVNDKSHKCYTVQYVIMAFIVQLKKKKKHDGQSFPYWHDSPQVLKAILLALIGGEHAKK